MDGGGGGRRFREGLSGNSKHNIFFCLTFFSFVLLHVNVLFLSFVIKHSITCVKALPWAFYDFKVVKSIKIQQDLLKNGQSYNPKKTHQNILFLNEWIPFIYTRFNKCGIKLLILINNYLWINHLSMPNTRCLWMIPVRKLDGTCIYRAQLCTSLA